MSDEDTKLIRAVAGGQTAALETLVKKYQRKVLDIAYRFLGDRAEAEDVSQEAFVRLYRSAGSFKGTSRFSTWLFRIVGNLCLNRLRKPRLHLAAAAQDRAEPEGAPGEAVQKEEAGRLVREAIRALPPRQQLAVILCRFEGLSYRETSEALECSIAAVESLLQRADAQIKNSLAQYVGER
jgi:RNA polymerase sigma-70 factor (ECF subfamily)